MAMKTIIISFFTCMRIMGHLLPRYADPCILGTDSV